LIVFVDGGKDVVIVNVIKQTRDMGVIFVSGALGFFIPIRVNCSNLSVFGKEFEDLVSMLLLQVGEEAGNHIWASDSTVKTTVEWLVQRLSTEWESLRLGLS
jgi:hypothetical protein